MADNYSQFSEVFCFKTKDAAQIFLTLASIGEGIHDGDVDSDDLLDYDLNGTGEVDKSHAELWQRLTMDQRDDLLTAYDMSRIDCEPNEDSDTDVWVYADEYGNLDGVGLCAQVALEITGDTDSIFTLTWSETCSKPRTGEFGGGYMVIHSGGIEYGHVWDMVKKAADAIRDTKK